MIDWGVVATIAAPIIALFVGVWINRRFEERPILISYFGHVSAFRHTPPGGQQMQINTHVVVLRNTGRRAATNVRLSHRILPSYNVWPSVAHNVAPLPDGSQEIVIPILIPGEQVTVSYLYFPPVTVAEVNTGIKCDQGFAKQINVLLQRQFPRWVNSVVAVLMIVGAIAIFYVAYKLVVAAAM